MAPSGRHEAHDRLLAEVQLMRTRLGSLGQRIDELVADAREAMSRQQQELDERCELLIEEIGSWTEVEVGVPTAVADLADGVDALEADIDALADVDSAGYALAVDRQVRAWRSRIDRLRLQGALGAMEAKDDLQGLAERLDRVRGDVLVDLERTVGDAGVVVDDLRKDVEVVLDDIRATVRKAVGELTSR